MRRRTIEASAGTQPHHLIHCPHEPVPSRGGGLRNHPGDILADPKHNEDDRLRQFDVILANSPYSIKQRDREAWTQDKWGRNFVGGPPQGRADYAFQQHILASLTVKGRCTVFCPYVVLFRNEEQAMRAKLIGQDWVEAVIGLGPPLNHRAP
jgi:type I restriction enzyme M protein